MKLVASLIFGLVALAIGLYASPASAEERAFSPARNYSAVDSAPCATMVAAATSASGPTLVPAGYCDARGATGIADAPVLSWLGDAWLSAAPAKAGAGASEPFAVEPQQRGERVQSSEAAFLPRSFLLARPAAVLPRALFVTVLDREGARARLERPPRALAP